MSPSIAKVLLRAFVFALASISTVALLPLVTRDLLGGGPLLYGILLGCFGAGGAAGGIFSHRLRQRLTTEAITRAAFVGFAVSVTGAALAPDAAVAGAAVALGGACWVISLSLFNVTVQLSTPRWVVGRALSTYQMAVFGGQALGSWTWGRAADLWGTEVALMLAGAVLLAGAAIGLKLAMPALQSLNLDPANRWQEPEVALELQPRSGPIMIRVEYQVREEDLRAFLALMEERRRMRLRNGARHWMLMRDLARPEFWIETYKTPTWLEYIRHNHRTTLADAEIGANLRALHAGPAPPRVQRLIIRPTHWSPDAAHPKPQFDPH
jgi:MFS family permease